MYDKGQKIRVIQEFISGNTITYTKYSASE